MYGDVEGEEIWREKRTRSGCQGVNKMEGEREDEGRDTQIPNLFLTAQLPHIILIISVPIKDIIDYYPRALLTRVGAYFNDIPWSGRTFTT